MEQIFEMLLEFIKSPEARIYLDWIVSGLIFFTLFFWRKAVTIIMKFIGDNNKTNDIVLNNVKTVNDNNNVVKALEETVESLKDEVKIMQELTLKLIQNVKIPESSKLEIMDLFRDKSNNKTDVVNYIPQPDEVVIPLKAKNKNIYEVE